MSKNRKFLNAAIPPDLYEKLEQEKIVQDRNLSDLVRFIIRDYFKRKEQQDEVWFW